MEVRRIAIAVFGFAVVSGGGLALDLSIFLLMVHLGFTPVSANFLSATIAVTFVYFASVSRIFSYQGRFLMGLFLAYLAYQAAAVPAASLAVGYLAVKWMSPPLAKLAVLPLTFSANYMFMAFLTHRRRAAAEGSNG